MPSPLKTRVKTRLTKKEIDELTAEVVAGTFTQEEIRALLFETDPVLLFNLYWLLATVAARSSAALTGLEVSLLQGMFQHVNNEAVVRCVLSVFKAIPIPEEVEGALYHFCFQAIQAVDSPIAHRSFALVICARLCKKYPALSAELLPLVKKIDENYGETSPGIRSACRQALRLLTPRSSRWYP